MQNEQSKKGNCRGDRLKFIRRINLLRDGKLCMLRNSAGGGSDLRDATLPLASHRRSNAVDQGKESKPGVLDTLRIFRSLNLPTATNCDMEELAELIPPARWPRVYFEGLNNDCPPGSLQRISQSPLDENRLVTFSPAVPGSGDGTVTGWKRRRPLSCPGTISRVTTSGRRLNREETIRSVDELLADAAFVERLV